MHLFQSRFLNGFGRSGREIGKRGKSGRKTKQRERYVEKRESGWGRGQVEYRAGVNYG